MNSKQRRKDKRKWKYSVVTTSRDYDHYEEKWNWLKNHYSANAAKCGWRDRPLSEVDYIHWLDQNLS